MINHCIVKGVCMKGYYIIVGNIDGEKNSGIKHKIDSQISALNKLSLECQLYVIKPHVYSENKFVNSLLYRLPLTEIGQNSFVQTSFSDADYLYIRKPYPTIILEKILRSIKCNNNNIKIIIEIPTYPYIKEVCRGVIDLPIIIKEKMACNKLKKSVDAIVTYSDHEKIFGVKTINISNGISVKEIKLKKTKTNDKTLCLIAVANISNWHGFDRVLAGLKEYYTKNAEIEVYFHIVGSGNEVQHLKCLTEKYKITKNVIFHGHKDGEQLDEIYNISDIGIGSLANHRKGLYKDSALKTREYCARGIPFVIASKDDDFPEEFKFAHRVKTDESPINIDSIVKFYQSLDPVTTPYDMRKYAIEKLTWEHKMLPISEFIKRSEY